MKTNDSLQQIATGENPDAIMFEPYTKTIITCNGRSKNLSVINPQDSVVTATIDVGGKPETAASDGNGILFVNIDDENEIAVVDLKTSSVVAHWPLGAEEISADNFSVLGNYSSRRGARTITIDEETGRLYLPAADFDTTNKQDGRA